MGWFALPPAVGGAPAGLVQGLAAALVAATIVVSGPPLRAHHLGLAMNDRAPVLLAPDLAGGLPPLGAVPGFAAQYNLPTAGVRLLPTREFV